MVIDNGGRTYCTVWGDLMTIDASQRGLAGTVIDGVCRDVPGIKRCRYPIFTRGCYMVTGKDRVQVDAVDVPVAISGVQVKPGDLAKGDDTGALSSRGSGRSSPVGRVRRDPRRRRAGPHPDPFATIHPDLIVGVAECCRSSTWQGRSSRVRA